MSATRSCWKRSKSSAISSLEPARTRTKSRDQHELAVSHWRTRSETTLVAASDRCRSSFSAFGGGGGSPSHRRVVIGSRRQLGRRGGALPASPVRPPARSLFHARHADGGRAHPGCHPQP